MQDAGASPGEAVEHTTDGLGNSAPFAVKSAKTQCHSQPAHSGSSRQHYQKQQASQLPPARRRKKRRSGTSRGWYTGRGLPRGLTRLRTSCGESGSGDRAVMKRYRAALRTARWVRAGWLAACAMRNILGSQKDQERDLTPAKATVDPAIAVACARKVALQRDCAGDRRLHAAALPRRDALGAGALDGESFVHRSPVNVFHPMQPRPALERLTVISLPGILSQLMTEVAVGPPTQRNWALSLSRELPR